MEARADSCLAELRPPSGSSRLPHVPLLQLRPHEEERRPLPVAVQLPVRQLVVDGAQPPHPHLGLPAAPLPQTALRHQAGWRGREAPLLTVPSGSRFYRENRKIKEFFRKLFLSLIKNDRSVTVCFSCFCSAPVEGRWTHLASGRHEPSDGGGQRSRGPVFSIWLRLLWLRPECCLGHECGGGAPPPDRKRKREQREEPPAAPVSEQTRRRRHLGKRCGVR